MRVSREQMAANRDRILMQAGQLFREKGFDGVTVSEVMKAAGLTHGGFYGHFASKDDLIAQTIIHMMSGYAIDPADLAGWIDTYLSAEHLQGVATGCPTAALAGLLSRQGPGARAALTQGMNAQVDRIAAALPDVAPAERRREAIGHWASMVGAMTLARAAADPALADELLRETRAWLRDRG